MSSVWIVFDDEDDAGIYGVFDNPEDAANFADEVKHMSSNGLKYAEYSVPWRLTDKATRIEM
ncbi:MAG: hypothetical protein K0R99_3136 [Microbacterium sp.]|jgi:hypothetical protein|uniref:hypothetical protein n=1 Tax=Microbacterium sp. TaxID=51671 RepID=UPI00261271C6|nr:hypothetical protein [Microbacterium sp.]MDF2561690.1 hypothetical protein [Microbacterium sp.]